MEFDKGRGKKESDENQDTLEARMTKLAEMELELREHKKEYLNKTKHLRESIKSLKNIVIEEVKQKKETVTVGNIQAEYIPQVVIKMKKDTDNEQ